MSCMQKIILLFVFVLLETKSRQVGNGFAHHFLSFKTSPSTKGGLEDQANEMLYTPRILSFFFFFFGKKYYKNENKNKTQII